MPIFSGLILLYIGWATIVMTIQVSQGFSLSTAPTPFRTKINSGRGSYDHCSARINWTRSTCTIRGERNYVSAFAFGPTLSNNMKSCVRCNRDDEDTTHSSGGLEGGEESDFGNRINKVGEEEELEVDEKPRYRSKLQRFNQVQSKKNVRTTAKKKKIKLKNHRRRQPKSISSLEETKINVNDDPMMPSINEEYGIDSFLRGEYDRPFADDAAAPLPKHSPSMIVEIALKALRDLDVPTTDHGAAVFLRFCAPLSRGDRWGGNSSGSISTWKAIMRGSLTPTMLARRLRASEEFAVLLDWEQLDVTEGTKAIPNEVLGLDSTIAFVNVALFFGDGTEPSMWQFTLKMFNGVWLIDSAVMNKPEWFME